MISYPSHPAASYDASDFAAGIIGNTWGPPSDDPHNEVNLIARTVGRLYREDCFYLSHMLRRARFDHTGPSGYRMDGRAGGWAWRITLDDEWVAAFITRHTLARPALRTCVARLRRLNRRAADAAYLLGGSEAVLRMLSPGSTSVW